MIANMLKYTFLIYHKDYIPFLEEIRKAGVVHIKEKAEGIIENELISDSIKKVQQLKEKIKILKARKIELSPNKRKSDASEIVIRINYLHLQLELKKNELQTISKETQLLQPWGEFSWETISKLKEAGNYLHFFTCNPSKYDKRWNKQFNLFEIKANKSAISFIIVSNTEETPDILADQLTLPKTSIPELVRQKEILTNEIESINNELNTIAATSIPVLIRKIERIQSIIDFKTVELQASKEANEKLNIIEGWVPENKEEELILQLEENGSFFLKSKPSKKDNVPILLKNNAFTKLFELVGSLYSLPSYREIDLTPFFAPFFMLFFGFCLGDAGYGLLTMLATLILRSKAKPNMKPVWTLGFLFGVSTVIMGLLGGTIFGIMLIDLKFNWLSTFQSIILDQNQLMYFSIALGLIQIVFGMCLKAARAIKIDGIKYALSTIGWIILIVGLGTPFALSKQEIITPELGKYLMIGFGSLGGILALFFNSPGKNIFLNFGLGLWDTYGTVTGLLGDVLSYIRLFALGLSSAVLGNVFNQLAFNLTGDIPVLSVVFTILILLLGHSINFFMAALGAFVHPLRLTFVEFYKNTGFEGGGKKYTPFKEA